MIKIVNRFRVKRALNKLTKNAGHPSIVAKRLEEEGITGIQARERECPIARYILQRTGIRVKVGCSFIRDGFRPVETPATIAVFIRNFDRGYYPNLISVEEESTGRAEEKTNV
jgi:hypothetical protein